MRLKFPFKIVLRDKFDIPSKTVHKGVVIAVPLEITDEIRVGHLVSTGDSQATVIGENFEMKKMSYPITGRYILIKLKGGKHNNAKIQRDKLKLYRFFVQEEIERYPVAYNCYGYLGLQDKQSVEFTISQNNFAVLTEKTKEKYAHFTIFNKLTNGSKIYAQLHRACNFVPRKKNED